MTYIFDPINASASAYAAPARLMKSVPILGFCLISFEIGSFSFSILVLAFFISYQIFL